MMEQENIEEQYAEDIYEDNVWVFLCYWCENKHIPHFLDNVAGWC